MINPFNLAPGDKIRRTRLHELFGGGRQGRISNSASSPNVFLFTDPKTGLQHGYIDGWRADGFFYYTGEGQQGDQEMKAGNAAILDHRQRGKTLRLFRGSGGIVTYEGSFEVDPDQPWQQAAAPATGGGPSRSVIVFRLRPLDAGIPQVLICPAAGDLSRRHLERTIISSVQVRDIEGLLSSEDRERIESIYPLGNLWVWGLRTGEDNDLTWARLRVGDTVTFFTERALRYVSRVTYKLDREPLAERLWGRDPEGKLFSHVFFVSQPSEIDVSLDEWNRLLDYHLDRSPQGTFLLDPDRTQKLESYLRLPGRAQPGPTVDQERGGGEIPRERPYLIGQEVTSSVPSDAPIDREAWRQLQDRRKRAHVELLDAVAKAAQHAQLIYAQNQYIDLIVDNRFIIEAKSLAGDAVAQARAALSQLYHYKFIHRDVYTNAQLVAVFSQKLPDDLTRFLDACNIAVVWRDGDGFKGYGKAAGAVPWLISNVSEILSQLVT